MINTRIRAIGTGVFLAWGAFSAVAMLAGQESRPRVVVAELADAIHPITAEFVIESLAEAERSGADVFVLQINTPGGLDSSMRDIIQAFLGSPVTVCLYVGPSGARSASAGFFMAMAADVVAMAPSTNMGAASPVTMGGGTDESTQRKLIQDAEAYIRSLAHGRGRPEDIAAEAVSAGRSFSAQEAIALGLADFSAADLSEVLAGLAGRPVVKNGRESTLGPGEYEVQRLEMSLRQRVLATVANPNIAYFLMLIGLAGIYFELSTPGAVLPGVLGGICLILGLLAFQALPISFAGLALIGLAILFFILEVKVTSYGLLTVAGLVAFVLGSLMLVPGPIPEMRLQPAFVVPTALGVAGVAGFLVWLVIRVHRGRVMTGTDGLIGSFGQSRTDILAGGSGRVFVHGENWRARSDMPIRAGDTVEIVAIESGMTVRVRPRAEKGT